MHCDNINQFIKYLQDNSFMFSQQRVEQLKKISQSQHPFMTLVTCSDSRVDIEYFKMDPLDKVFVIRNIGNTILSNEGSIEYGVRHLNTPILFILAHTNCGAVKASIKDYHHCSLPIKRELNNIEPAIVEIDKNKSFNEQWIEWVKKNLDLQLEIAEEKFKDLVQAWKLTIIGWILDIDNSFGQGYGKLYIHKVISTNTDCDLDI